MGSQSAKTMATGSAAGGATDNASGQLERCESPLGTVSLIENQSAGWYTILTGEYRLPPTANLLRLLVQQSNCFVVVERGAAGMNAMTRERALQQSGEMRGGSATATRAAWAVRSAVWWAEAVAAPLRSSAQACRPRKPARC